MKIAVESLASATADAWRHTADDIARLWDADAFRYYKAEEVPDIFHRFSDATDYWRANEAMHADVRLTFTDVVPLPLDGGWSMATMALRWDIGFSAGAPGPLANKAMGGWNHVVALMTETDAGLRWAGWSETPDAPITYVRRLYEAQAQL